MITRNNFAGLMILSATIIFSSNSFAAACVDSGSDPDGDGWGYENGESCTVALSNNPATVNSGTCIDADGDGWGWNGVSSCTTSNNSTANIVTVAATTTSCVDSDGDGWGWNGVTSCAVNASPATPVVVTAATPTTTVTVQSGTSAATPVNTSSCRVVLSPGANLYNAVGGGRGKICLQPGSYTLPQQLSLRSNQSLVGLDPSNPATINTSAVRSLVTTGQTNITIENLIIEGNRTGAREFGILVGTGSRNILINNVAVQNTFGIGIGVTGSHTITVRGGSIRNIGLDTRLRQALWVSSGSSNVTIDGVHVRGRENDQAGGDHAITCIDGVNGFTVKNVHSEFAGSSAVAVNNCSNIVVSNNQLSNGREFGVDIVNGSIGATVSGNRITDFDRPAMVFDDHSWQCVGCGNNPTEVTISNNQMLNNNRINLTRCKGIAVDRQMIINPANSQLQSTDWIKINGNNTVDADSALYCDHIH